MGFRETLTRSVTKLTHYLTASALASDGQTDIPCHAMSVTEVMQEIDTLSPEERIRVQAYLIHLRRKDDPAHREELKQRLNRMQTGHSYAEDDLRPHLNAPANGAAE